MCKLIYCTDCDRLTEHISKLDALREYKAVCDICRKMNPLFSLTKPDDPEFVEKISFDVSWIDWNEDRSFNSKHDTIAIGRSLLIAPFSPFFTWMTTVVTEIIENVPGRIIFRTENSLYELRLPVVCDEKK